MMLAQAEEADQQAEDPQALPRAMVRREQLLKKMDEASAPLEARARACAVERDECERQGAAGQ